MSDPVAIALIVAVSVVGTIVFLAIVFRARVRSIKANMKTGEVNLELEPNEKRASIERLKRAETEKGVGPHGQEAVAQEDANKAAEDIGKLSRKVRKRILWVDDQSSNNRHEREALIPLGIEVVQASSNEDARREMRDYAFDLVITDLGRRHESEDGFNLIAELGAGERRTPVIVYTSSRGKHNQGKKALELGAVGVTASPSELMHEVLGVLSVGDATTPNRK